jgi:hypothetical protein
MQNVFSFSLIKFEIYIDTDIKMVDENFIISQKYFVAVCCFLSFNFFAMVGNMLPGLYSWVLIYFEKNYKYLLDYTNLICSIFYNHFMNYSPDLAGYGFQLCYESCSSRSSYCAIINH